MKAIQFGYKHDTVTPTATNLLHGDQYRGPITADSITQQQQVTHKMRSY